MPVVARDTPGFIVNRVARPFYSEAIRIYEEGIADMATIDEAMRRVGGFKMGPFELMDLIGNDVNYAVTESVFTAFYYDPRYRPSITQKKQVEAGWLGRKSGRGYYNYSPGVEMPQPAANEHLQQSICQRIVTMLINEAYDALYLNIASAADLDLAMTKGVNYPKGLIAWGKEWGLEVCAERMQQLYQIYQEDRYRTTRGFFMEAQGL
jgi:3-hydroxybutyryl-CoA dehydrogenase